ncbi:MAG: response regulator [Candidatus Synoicihabitans palmerolidicus]|nr:response regulator [Candidatus Synoicihabitans palmerolidicus]
MERFTAAPSAFDIVVTDLTIGGATGVDSARRVFELRPGLPLIIATDFMNARDIETARSLGVQWFLAKPFSFMGLARAYGQGPQTPRQTLPLMGTPHGCGSHRTLDKSCRLNRRRRSLVIFGLQLIPNHAEVPRFGSLHKPFGYSF